MAEKKFGKRQFRADPLLATKGIAMQVRLAKLMGGAVDRLPSIIALRDKNEEASNAQAIGALMDVLGRVEPEDVVTLCQDVLSNVEMRRESGDWDDVDMDADFAENPGEIYQVIIWALQVQIGPFFAGLLGAGNRKTPAKA